MPQEPKIDKTIVLVGIMGSGKSAIGARLALKLGLPFVDMDKYIEDREGITISEIFEKHGEPYFRGLEREVIDELVAGEPCVLATGGGAFINDEIRALIKKKARSVCIKADFDIILERVSRKNTRPLLEKGDKASILKDLMEKRCPIYEQADIIVDSSEGEHDIVVYRIIEELS